MTQVARVPAHGTILPIFSSWPHHELAEIKKSVRPKHLRTSYKHNPPSPIQSSPHRLDPTVYTEPVQHPQV